MTTTRRLAAIMAADVAGFSVAMERDEEGTFARVTGLRQNHFGHGTSCDIRFQPPN